MKQLSVHYKNLRCTVDKYPIQMYTLIFEHFISRLIKYFSEIYETTVAVVFFGSVVTICTAMSFLQLELV